MDVWNSSWIPYIPGFKLPQRSLLAVSISNYKKHAEDSASSSTTRPLTRVETQQELYIGLTNTTIESGPMPKVKWTKLWRLKIHDN